MKYKNAKEVLPQESGIRRIIIKQRKGYETMKGKIKEILASWGLEDSDVKQIYDTTWQVGEQYVLKVYDSLEMLERNLKVLQVLEKMNIPVGKIVLTHDKTPYVQQDEAYY